MSNSYLKGATVAKAAARLKPTTYETGTSSFLQTPEFVAIGIRKTELSEVSSFSTVFRTLLQEGRPPCA